MANAIRAWTSVVAALEDNQRHGAAADLAALARLTSAVKQVSGVCTQPRAVWKKIVMEAKVSGCGVGMVVVWW